MSDQNIFDHDQIQCRACGEKLDSAMGVNKRPENDSWSICVYCGEVSRYVVSPDGAVSMREVSLAELAEFNRHHPNAVKSVLQFQMNKRKKRG